MKVKKSSKSSWFTSCFKHQEQTTFKITEPPPPPVEKKITPDNSVQRISITDFSNISTLPEDLSTSLAGSNLYIFSLAELKIITQSFSSTNILGEGGFGPVYKGFIDDKLRPGLDAQPVAVKLLNQEGGQGHLEWLTEVIFLGQLRHPHLVKLIGYCLEDEHGLLVYEYMPRGSLENQLFRRFSVCLPWSTRMKIALEAAKGLAFLHEAKKSVIYRDFKASNILLDSDYTAKLSDFGLAKDGPEGDDTHVSTRVMGTHGYAAPEYLMTGHLTSASDVYSFGVVLAELLTGRKSMDKSLPNREQNLAEWARPQLKVARKLNRIMDPRLEGQYSETGAQTAADLAYQCLSHRPKARPTMTMVVETIELLKNFNEMEFGTFVYNAPTECKIESPKKEEEQKDSKKDIDGHRRHHRQHDHQRHRRTKSPVVHSEIDLYRNLSAGTDSPP
ncbi:hypothetical protein OSB04_020421 [Centaurea solstitialis]|uniref:non-specific serine/threonine protein kinase n=1 Tax=Centaurea solstitialis TaxID=347529 RepID=A0AA38SZU1_9ASTR|nr:hypothetical protein OSB04_020421 [Centaurea solstitialis]